MSERIAQAFWCAVLLVCAFSADQFLAAQPVSDEHKENDICSQQNKYSYLVNGVPHYVPYSVIDGQDVVEGDIVIGRSDGPGYFPPVVPDYVRGQRTRWGNGVAPYVVPYVLDSSLSDYEPALIRRAMSEWESKTSIIFREIPRTTDWKKENYVKFIPGSACRSNSLGIKERDPNKGEIDNINIVEVARCGNQWNSWGYIAHEIGHVLGLGHEQSRKDRGDYITMLWGNIMDGPSDDINRYRKQYCQVIWDQQTLANTDYDFDSIMHYRVDGFSKVPPDKSCEKVKDYKGKPQCLAFEPNPDKFREQKQKLGRDIEIGQRDHLSLLDIAAVKTLYPDAPYHPDPPTKVQPCSVVTETKITEGGVTTTTTKTEPCPDDRRPPVSTHCCHEKIVVARPCYPDGGRRPVKVNWPRPDRWCRSEWCRPRPRPLCNRDGWIEDRPPFDDWDE